MKLLFAFFLLTAAAGAQLRTVADHPLRWTALNTALAAADYETALHVQGPKKNCFESDQFTWGTPYPTRREFYTRGLLIDGATEGVGYLLKRTHHARGFWRVPFLAVTAWHAAGIRSNLACH